MKIQPNPLVYLDIGASGYRNCLSLNIRLDKGKICNNYFYMTLNNEIETFMEKQQTSSQ